MKGRRRLSREDISEATGVDDLQGLESIEVLFTTCDEIDSLGDCRSLRRLSMLDNGLKCISNLEPVSATLFSLCLCDQDITTMENLFLPNLRELFLHRNCITRIENLHTCPRLRKLWLSQNKITAITGLHAVPELEEIWLQANAISKLTGLDGCVNLKSLFMAGNQISEYAELRRLAPLPQLRELSFQDIHFGRCDIVEDAGYGDFVLCYLPQVHNLDGVPITREKEETALALMNNEVRLFNESLAALESDYLRDLQHIGGRQQQSTSQSVVLEKEMAKSFRELEGLVNEGRTAIAKQLTMQQNLFDNNLRSFEKNLESLTSRARSGVEQTAARTVADLDSAEALFCVLERLAVAEAEVVAVLCALSGNRSQPHPRGSAPDEPTEGGGLALSFQSLSDSAPDFHMFASALRGGSQRNGGGTTKARPGSSSASSSSNRRQHSPRNSVRASAAAAGSTQVDVGSPNGHVHGSPARDDRTDKDTIHLLRLFRVHYFLSTGVDSRLHGGTDSASAVSSHTPERARAASLLSSFSSSHADSSSLQRVYTIIGSGTGQCPLEAAVSCCWSFADSSLFFSEPATALLLLGDESSFDFTSLDAMAFEDDASGQEEEEDERHKQQLRQLQEAGRLGRLEAARRARIVLLLSASLGVSPSGVPLLPEDNVPPTRIPVDGSARKKLLSDLRSMRRTGCFPLVDVVSTSAGDRNRSCGFVYVLPTPSVDRSGDVGTVRGTTTVSSGGSTNQIKPEFLCLCLCGDDADLLLHGDSAGVKSLEEELELLLVRGRGDDDDDRLTKTISSYEHEVAEEVKRLGEQLELGLDSGSADQLRQADKDVAERARAIKVVKSEIEAERRQQEATLRELRLAVESAAASAAAVNTGKNRQR